MTYTYAISKIFLNAITQPQSPNHKLESEVEIKLDQKYFKVIMKQNGGHFIKSIIL